MIGAELGNSEGSGQAKFPVSSPNEAIRSAKNLADFFANFGRHFLTSIPSKTRALFSALNLVLSHLSLALAIGR